MRCSRRLTQGLCRTPVLRLTVPRNPKEEKEHFERMEQKAKEVGFGRRDSGDDKVFMDKTFPLPAQVGGVAVANLPAKVKEETAFDKYERSSTEFTSIVSSHHKEKSALGAGFGAKPDKRLGFLRPKHTLQPFTSATSSVVPKYDENGMPVDDNLSADQMMKKRMDYLRSIEGTTMSRNEHFLLADLDFDKDAALFGSTREEFERNVIRLKNVIVAYSKWERTDNFYYYATIVLKLTVLWVLIECVQQYYDLRLFERNYDTFAEVMEKEIAELVEKRERDFALTREQLRATRPDFAPVINAIVAEKQRIDGNAHAASVQAWGQRAAASHAALPAQQLAMQLHDEVRGGATTTTAPSSPTETGDAQKPLSALDVPAAHPMDTMGDAAYAKLQEAEERAREMRRLQAHVGKPGHFHVLTSVYRRITGASTSSLSQPLQQDDFVRFSYAASPTSVGVLRTIRRTLLPRSEDYTQVVREEMLAYKRAKEVPVTGVSAP